MPNPNAGPVLTFRNTIINEDGKEIIEERTLSGLSTDELTKYLMVPWENYAELKEVETEKSNKSEEFGKILKEQFEQLQFKITGSKSNKNERQVLIQCLPILASDVDVKLSKRKFKQAEESNISPHIKIHVAGEKEVPDCFKKGSNIIDIQNNGIMVINKENLYAIINIEFKLDVSL